MRLGNSNKIIAKHFMKNLKVKTSVSKNIIQKISLGIVLFIAVFSFGYSFVFATGNYTFDPGAGTFYVGRQFEVNINMTTNQGTTAADIEIFYDSCKLTVVDALPAAGTQIFTGTVFPTYPAAGNISTFVGCSGNIKLTGFTTDPAGVLQGGGSGAFGKIRFKVRDVNLGGSLLDIRTDGFGISFTLDSNISDVNGFDMLNAATDGNYILRLDKNPVPDADDKPFFGGFNPALNAAGILIGANILFNTFDNESGVELSSITNSVTINGGAPTVYTSASPGVTPSCVNTNLDAVSVCNLTIDPASNFPYDALVCSTVNANDLSQTAITFTPTPNFATPITSCFRTQYDLVAPNTINNIPGKNSINIAINTPFSFNLIDGETGSNINTVIVTVKGINYTVAGPNFFTYTGTPNNYAITIPTLTLPTFIQNETVSVRIRAQDNATQITVPTPNSLDETYTFKIGDTLPPFVSSSLPLPTTNFTNACTDPIVSIVEDTGSGVNINSVRIFVSATNLYYTAAGPNFFTYTGTSSAYTVSIPAPVGCWTPNVPIAVGVFARDVANNYLDAYIYGLGGNASSTVTTIVNTVTNTIYSGGGGGYVNTIYQDRDVIREVAGLTPPEIIEKVIYLYKAKPNADQKKQIVENVNKALFSLSNAGEKIVITKINDAFNKSKKYIIFEGRKIILNGAGIPLSTVEIEIGEIRSGIFVTVGADGTWSTDIPGSLLGNRVYTLTARTVVDGLPTGSRNTIATIIVFPWWWILAFGMFGGLIYQAYRLHRRKNKTTPLRTKVLRGEKK